jgi:drug/metabolite transporter (DMT)-like permease
MYRPFLSVVVAFVGYSVLNISQAGQKIGLAVLRTRRLAGISIWLVATLGTSLAAFINLYAISQGNVSLVGAMAGSGLGSLALFSWLVMKEPISRWELIGIAVVFAAAVLIGIFSGGFESPRPRVEALFLYLGALTAVYAMLWAVLRRRIPLVATVIGGFGGTLGGFVTLFQKVSTTNFGRSLSFLSASGETPEIPAVSGVGAVLTNPYTLGWVLLSIVSMVVMQFAYRRGKAIRIIPAFSATYVVIPILGGVLVFEEVLHPVQWIGVALVIGGILLITLKRPRKRQEGSIDPPF